MIAANVAEFQERLLYSLGIHLKGYGPDGCVGRGAVVYGDVGLQNRILLAGFQGAELKKFMLGEVSFTTRIMYRLIRAAHGTDRSGGISFMEFDTERSGP